MEILSDLGQAFTVTILDTLSCSARPLVQQAIATAPQRAVVVGTTPHPPFTGDIAAHVVVGTDAFGWGGSDTSTDRDATAAAAMGCLFTDKVVQAVRASLRGVTDDAVWVVVDSASDLILADGVQTLCNAIQQLRELPKIKRVLLVVHGDLHGTNVAAALRYISEATMDVRKERYSKGTLMAVVEQEVGSADKDKNAAYVDITHRRPQGKVVRFLKRIRFPTETDAWVVMEDVSEAKKAKATETSDPTANLTFNLNLTDEEKRAKDEVVLPYTHSEQTKDRILKEGGGQGKIYYEADDGDDFDEEDPDEDLDI